MLISLMLEELYLLYIIVVCIIKFCGVNEFVFSNDFLNWNL